MIAHSRFDAESDGYFEDISDYSINWIMSFSRILYYAKPKDYALFLHHLLYKQDILNQSSLNEMIDFISPCPGEEDYLDAYGLGIMRYNTAITNGIRMYGHAGSMWGFTCMGVYLPDYGVSIVLMMNIGAQESVDEIVWSAWDNIRNVVVEHIDPL